jgi:two-component system LytT family sensor kinase
LHVAFTRNSFFEGQLILYTTMVLVTVLLLVLTVRALKLPGSSFARIAFVLCALAWTMGGLVQVTAIVSGLPHTAPLAAGAHTLQYMGAAAFPISVLALLSPFAAATWRRSLLRALMGLAAIFAIVIPLQLGVNFSPRNAAIMWADAAILAAGVLVSLPARSMPRAIFWPSLLVTLGVAGAAAYSGEWDFISAHIILLVVLLSFFLFARFRYADVFVRYGVRILLAGLWASLLAFFASASLTILHAGPHSVAPQAMHIFLVMVVANSLLLSFTFVDDRISTLVNRWLFHPPNYRTEAHALGEKLRSASDAAQVITATRDAALRPLALSRAEIVETADPSLAESELVERAGGEVVIPIATAGRVSRALIVAPGHGRPGLVTNDLNYLRGVIAQCARRLDALEREREAIERESREAVLVQQVTEAELRALRAQINPHFLFNSLNTIADLIVRDPSRAEAMTLRLASVFRHVLAHSTRTLTTLRDEFDFVRTYLHIEEARFGDRLTMQVELDAAIAGVAIPSLILQPLVENALKHGLGPKPGPGRLWIIARAENGRVQVTVEDDGLGLSTGAREGQAGMGLANVRERLKTLYEDRATLVIEPRTGGGTRATLMIPSAVIPQSGEKE